MLLLILLPFGCVLAELPSKIFDLPSLTIYVEQPYLIRNQSTNLTCELSAGWSGAQLAEVFWLRNGEQINATTDRDYEHQGVQLVILSGKASSEGDYQCLANVHNITLSNKQVVDTRLVSSPVKLRRARITKFDKISEIMVSVRQGEVTRLPCAGMPDVIPGPPEICFEKDDVEGCFGEREPGSSNYLATPTGLQISMVQPADSGSYYCVVRNEYTKQSRRSPKPVILVVHPSGQLEDGIPPPQLDWPTKQSTIDKPIVVDVVLGQDALLECVFANAKPYWKKHNDLTPPISSDIEAPVHMIFGNLRFRSVMEGDAGIYSCHGVSQLELDPDLENGVHPRVFYQLIVHGPTNVNLTLNENPMDRSWELSCQATNLRYEIPMAFVNGTALVDAIDQMGVPSSTNFFTNPINVTMQVNQTFSGSVQCISRPAMDEAEVYGIGLDRGRSKNVFVISSPDDRNTLITQGPSNTTAIIGQDVTLLCAVQRIKSKFWTKDGRYVRLWAGPHSKTQGVGSHSLMIKNVTREDEGWYSCQVTGKDGKEYSASAYLTIVGDLNELQSTNIPLETTTEPFVIVKDDALELTNVGGFVTGTSIRVRWTVVGTMNALGKIANFRVEVQRKSSGEDNWIEGDRVDSHIRATTIKGLLPNFSYKLRVILHRENGSKVVSNSTDYLFIEKPIGDMPPLAPKIESVASHSSSTIEIVWSHEAPIESGRARGFNVQYKSETEDTMNVIKVDGNTTTALLGELRPDTAYSIRVEAENQAGSVASPSISVRTGVEMNFFASLWSLASNSPRQTLLIGGALVFLFIIMTLICCLIYCNIRTPRKKKANGKYIDTSYRIFHEQKVHKSRIQDDLYMFEDMDEHSPLKQKADDRADSPSEPHLFAARGNDVPNLYGNIDEVLEVDEPQPPKDPTYVSAPRMSNVYGMTPTARCYSPDSGTSHEMLVSYNTGTLRGSVFQSSPMMTSSPQRLSAYKGPDSLLYSPAGTASSLADTSSSDPARLQCDSPTHANTDSSDQGIRVSSRNSQSSSDGSRQPSMSTFKSNTPSTPVYMSTFERRPKQIPTI